MAYSELIKKFERVREYMREFYIYGFKGREEYTMKSARSYDDERRRMESWLGEYMGFRQNPDGKTVFLSIDSRSSCHNPLYRAWKAKSFTDGDITLHFLLFDILHDPEVSLTLREIMEKIDQYLADFPEQRTFDTSTIRKKLNEYCSEGLILAEKQGKTVRYRRAEDSRLPARELLHFFSETAPCGVIGSFLLDKEAAGRDVFAFKHHYITGAMDSEILCSLFQAISEQRNICIETVNRHKERTTENHVVPLQILFSVQGGRQYLMAYVPKYHRITSFRLDSILTVACEEPCPEFSKYREGLELMRKHMWGVCTQNASCACMERVEFTIRYTADELHIPRRLEREKRCGTVERLDANTSRFTAEVYDASELIPWIRTFICRITEIHFSNKALEEQFRRDMQEMYTIYGLEGGENSDIQ